MATVDSVDAFSLLQNMAPMSYDSSRLVDVACIAYGHIDSLCVKNLRHQFFASVEKQFRVSSPNLIRIPWEGNIFPSSSALCNGTVSSYEEDNVVARCLRLKCICLNLPRIALENLQKWCAQLLTRMRG